MFGRDHYPPPPPPPAFFRDRMFREGGMYDGLYDRRGYESELYDRRYAMPARSPRDYPPLPPGLRGAGMGTMGSMGAMGAMGARDAYPPPPIRSPSADYDRGGYDMYTRRSPPSAAAARYSAAASPTARRYAPY